MFTKIFNIQIIRHAHLQTYFIVIIADSTNLI